VPRWTQHIGSSYGRVRALTDVIDHVNEDRIIVRKPEDPDECHQSSHSGLGHFVRHYLEMVIAMAVGLTAHAMLFGRSSTQMREGGIAAVLPKPVEGPVLREALAAALPRDERALRVLVVDDSAAFAPFWRC
jgi:hypothetical protein